MTFITQSDQQQRRENAAKAAHIERGLWEVFNHYPDLVVCEANATLVREWCSQFSGVHDAVPSVALFREVVEANRDEFRKSFVLKPIRQQITDLVMEIVGLLRTSRSETEVQALLRNKLSWMKRDELLAYRDAIIRERSLRKVPVAELKEAVASFHEKEARTQNTLPAEYTRERIIAGSAHLVKFLVARYGAKAVNERLEGE